MGVYILDLLVDNLRLQALQRICKGKFSHTHSCSPRFKCPNFNPLHPFTGYKPQVEVSFVTEELAFDGVDSCLEFLKKAGCVISGDSKEYQLNTKDSVIDPSAIITKEKLLL